ncbi:hypothetical protein B0H16DRAFT_1555954 [Mycena metata]|uniref:Uncharacterized protein n=1 Tax=Mycena metata TaxID=1033252 RepID=A0AAD7IQC8_9AGAR|nr:hypothetical protein B0H16DRAFT_1555954 [Mycena metata]
MPSQKPLPLHEQLDEAVKEALPAVTRIRTLLREYELDTHLENATDDALERYHKSGDLWLHTCFLHTLWQIRLGDRPVGHYNAIRDRVMCRAIFALVMERSDAEVPGASKKGEGPARIGTQVEAVEIFVGVLFRFAGFAPVLFWYRQVFLASIVAADTVYLRFHGLLLSNVEAGIIMRYNKPDADNGGRYKHAVGLLTAGSAPPALDSLVKPLAMSDADDAASDADHTASDPPESIDTDAPSLRKKVVASVSEFIVREGQALWNTAFPDGILALAVAAPRAFMTGFLSTFNSGAPRGVKRKAYDTDGWDSEESEDDNGDILLTPRRRNKLFIRAYAPSPPSPRTRRSFCASAKVRLPIASFGAYPYPRHPVVPQGQASAFFSLGRPISRSDSSAGTPQAVQTVHHGGLYSPIHHLLPPTTAPAACTR